MYYALFTLAFAHNKVVWFSFVSNLVEYVDYKFDRLTNYE